MKEKSYQIWSIIHPILLYYAVSSIAFFAMTIILGEAQEIYMLKQTVSSACTVPFLVNLWKQDRYVEDVVYGKLKQPVGKTVLQLVLAGMAVGALGVALNNFIAMTPLVEISAGFQTANENFFSGGFLLEILASCMVVPIAEEILFRGIVLKRGVGMVGERMGVLLSALLFGVIHMNVVQFLYATLLGILLAVIVIRTGRVSMAIVGHGAANMIAILRAETGILDFSYQPDLAGIGFSLMMTALGAVAAWLLVKQCDDRQTGEK